MVISHGQTTVWPLLALGDACDSLPFSCKLRHYYSTVYIGSQLEAELYLVTWVTIVVDNFKLKDISTSRIRGGGSEGDSDSRRHCQWVEEDSEVRVAVLEASTT